MGKQCKYAKIGKGFCMERQIIAIALRLVITIQARVIRSNEVMELAIQ